MRRLLPFAVRVDLFGQIGDFFAQGGFGIRQDFNAKTDILRFLWAQVLNLLLDDIQKKLKETHSPRQRQSVAAKTFVSCWLTNTDHFRLGFISNDVSRTDVNMFAKDAGILQHFQVISDLVRAVSPSDVDIKTRMDVLVAGMIGIALCFNTIADYPWSKAEAMTNVLLAAVAAERG